MLLLNTMPLWVSALIGGIITLITASIPALIRRRINLDTLRVNNEVAWCKFATVGVLYAVLIAFAAYFGGYGNAAMTIATIYILGLIATPFLPETRGKPLPR